MLVVSPSHKQISMFSFRVHGCSYVFEIGWVIQHCMTGFRQAWGDYGVAPLADESRTLSAVAVEPNAGVTVVATRFSLRHDLSLKSRQIRSSAYTICHSNTICHFRETNRAERYTWNMLCHSFASTTIIPFASPPSLPPPPPSLLPPSAHPYPPSSFASPPAPLCLVLV